MIHFAVESSTFVAKSASEMALKKTLSKGYILLLLVPIYFPLGVPGFARLQILKKVSKVEF